MSRRSRIAALPGLRSRILGVAAVFAVAAGCGEATQADSVVQRVLVDVDSLRLTVGKDSALAARVQYESGTFADGRVHWASREPHIATVDQQGRVTAIVEGNTMLAASAGGKSAFVDVRVNLPPVTTVRVSPTTAGVTIGANVSLSALALRASGDTARGRPVTWSTSNAAVATVSATGVVSGRASGSANITATVEGIAGTATVSVTPVPVAAVGVAPATATVILTRTLQLTATTRAADSTVLTGRAVTWTSSAPAVASVSATGLVSALTPGVTTITATSETRRGTSRVTVIPVPVATVTVIPADAGLLVGKSIKLSAAALDSTGTALIGRAFTWSTSNPAVATVDSLGNVTGVAAGTARITVRSEGKAAVATITVTLPPVARVVISPASWTVVVGGSVLLQATAYDAAGTVITGRTVTWLSGAPSVAKVDAGGVATGLAPGTVLVFATIDGVRGSATVVVR